MKNMKIKTVNMPKCCIYSVVYTECCIYRVLYIQRHKIVLTVGDAVSR